jgi:CHAT domain-containing protein
MEENPAAHLEAALAILDEAIALAQRSGWPQEIARAYMTKAEIGTGRLPRSAVIADFLAAIEQVEKLRDLQSNRHIRGRFLWDWVSAYYRLARFALETPGSNLAEGDLDLALATMERLRGRLLIDLLDSAGATEVAFPAGAERDTFVEVRRRIAATQRRLFSPGLSPADRRAANADLERLELEESYLVTRLGRSSPSYATLSRGQIPTIENLQDLLDEDQALIAYQVSPPDAAGVRSAWAVVLSRDGKSVHPLPDGGQLEERLAIFSGLLHRRDTLERDAAARLYDDLMAGPLSGLGDTITRLVIIPDGALHRLPFGALRGGASREPLAVRYEISLIPSASLWAHWKRIAPGELGPAVLALADPSLPGMGAAPPAAERFASLTDGVQLGRLPHARDEARAVVRRIGGASRLLTGDQASERFLKDADLNRFGVLHFATHAVVDDREPQRSAIVLAPGSPEEDGLLQLREIVAMDLTGKIVVLSACSSASGELTAGEGVVGLARGLFQAGARAVVGSLWPLRDDEAAILVEALAGELSRGASIGTALTAARRARIAAGAPSAAWAGLVVLGDADLVPLPGGREPEIRWPLWGSLGLMSALAGLSWFLLARSRRQSRA